MSEQATFLSTAVSHNGIEMMERHQRGVTLWITGLSGAGKTTISSEVEKKLRAVGYKVEVLDGDVVRQNLTKGLGFSKEDREENIRRIGFVAELLTRNQIIVIVSVISPYREMRQEMRHRIGNFIEVYVNAPIEVCEQRDVKGLYKKARSGKIKDFTGIDALYEPPLNPEVECRTDIESLDVSVAKVLAKLAAWDIISETVLYSTAQRSSPKTFCYLRPTKNAEIIDSIGDHS
ncbi:adenylyl-sulfate kinase [Nostoc sp. PA-18-2419]|uniref:adenylyl-sulfate kinase n=1 Tax=Nostoc sp. PA-18-2419 TaxID=2575443 RepID=UPI0011093970|nr:adenylyl-sulfate kinase [Nostoc sp. PA-18-2419]